MTGGPPPPGPRREVLQGDGVAFLARGRLPAGHAVVTSLPDHSELPALGYEGWRRWFVETAALACGAVADEAVAVFYQTDVKHDGRWVDKAYLVQQGAERAGAHLLWHKVVCRAPAGVTTFGRPAYAHLLCLSRSLRLPPGRSSPDVLPRLGEMTWPRAMGREACDAVARFLLADTACRTVVDPFCGVGTMLAVANAFGLDAVGVELSPRRAERARLLRLGPPDRLRPAGGAPAPLGADHRPDQDRGQDGQDHPPDRADAPAFSGGRAGGTGGALREGERGEERGENGPEQR
ncbi:class I SAM-dependent methyltransferase [Anaeromyxobacter paludicola]|uniref:Methyltransferase n=1 Tax=Anaeromyxobacter paludicola TaxID=2918171 RepID=A0ABM7X670_9BACT|nr:SAM-dependent methyltransferase [Anaeromyxobacter paludicola]BDG07313.1 hypothetical protein AMPC_04260 [Anaeromyxobacter paludicola]